MAYPSTKSVLLTTHAYIRDTIERLGKERGLAVLLRQRANWEKTDPAVARVYSAAIAEIVKSAD